MVVVLIVVHIIRPMVGARRFIVKWLLLVVAVVVDIMKDGNDNDDDDDDGTFCTIHDMTTVEQ